MGQSSMGMRGMKGKGTPNKAALRAFRSIPDAYIKTVTVDNGNLFGNF
jgi:hypothetical protein